jgi:two-component system response regulator AgrA
MLNIIICEDSNAQRTQIENIINEEITGSKMNLSVALSTGNPKEVIEHIRFSSQKNFIYFLDVELDSEINGIELAQSIREYDPMGYIVFVTSHAELTLLTFEYKIQAMDFILKYRPDNLKSRVIECLKAAANDFEKLTNMGKGYISIDVGSKIINFNPNEILFFETDKDHRIRIHAINEQIEFYSSLKEIEAIVPSYFYKTHRSYLVNTKNIKSIDKENFIIFMTNGERCYASKRYMKGLLNIV